MRTSDYLRLARASVKSRKRSTRNTVSGIAFGLSVLIPVLFFTLAFYADLIFTVNRTASMSALFLPYTETRGGKDSEFAMGADDFSAIAEMNAVTEVVPAALYSFDTAQNYSFTLEGKQVFSDNYSSYLPFAGGGIFRIPFYPTIKVIDTETSGGKLVPSGILSDMGASSVLKYGDGFTGNAGEVILSELFVRAWEMDPAEVVGKKLTLTATALISTRGNMDEYYLDDDNDPDNAFSEHGVAQRAFTADLFRDFTVCGIVGEEYYRCNTLTVQDCHIWLPANFSAAPPEVRIQGGRHVVTYPEEIASAAEKTAESGLFFPAIPAVRYARFGTGDSERVGLTHSAPVSTAFLQCRDFNGATEVYSAYERFVRMEDPEIALNEDLGIAVAGFANLRIFNTVCSYIMVVMIAFGGTVLLATLLNLFNSVNYSVQKRKYYFGMLQAIGIKQRGVSLLCFFEVLLIFAYAFPWAAAFGAGLSYGTKLLADYFFSTSEGQAAALVFTATISLDFSWYFLALAVSFVFALAISLIFSALACRGAVKKDIVRSLATEQGS